MEINDRCCESVYPNDRYGSFHPKQCAKKGVVTRDGNLFCKIHDPVEKKRKDAERTRIWEAERDARYKNMEKQTMQNEVYPLLVEIINSIDWWWRLPNASRTIENFEPIILKVLHVQGKMKGLSL